MSRDMAENPLPILLLIHKAIRHQYKYILKGFNNKEGSTTIETKGHYYSGEYGKIMNVTITF